MGIEIGITADLKMLRRCVAAVEGETKLRNSFCAGFTCVDFPCMAELVPPNPEAALVTAPPTELIAPAAPATIDWQAVKHVGSSAPGEYAITNQSPISARLRTELMRSSNFLKSAKWSPDGTCLLTTSEDCIARLLELPPSLDAPISLRCAVRAHEGETIYDSAWYPLMNSNNPETCLFASCSRGHPIHLWDAFTGKLTASYTALKNVAELDAALALAFRYYC